MSNHTITLTTEQLAHVHNCLVTIKNDMTRDGQVWDKHTTNAQIRTKLENAKALPDPIEERTLQAAWNDWKTIIDTAGHGSTDTAAREAQAEFFERMIHHNVSDEKIDDIVAASEFGLFDTITVAKLNKVRAAATEVAKLIQRSESLLDVLNVLEADSFGLDNR